MPLKKTIFQTDAWMNAGWWKVLALLLLVYGILGGLLFGVPDLPVIRESIRNIYFHVGMWFGMLLIMIVSAVYSIRYLGSMDPLDDLKALSAVRVGLVLGTLGLITGMIWAHNTWGRFWVNDPKLNGAAVGMLCYLAYMLLRASLDAADKRARLAAVYNVFAFVLFFIFIMVLPRMAEASIHPGHGGNPALSAGDLDPSMRKVFFPIMAGWMLLGLWLFTVDYRISRLMAKTEEQSENE